jgi:hypothetical protein
VPTVLDELAARALALPGRDEQAAFRSPAELAAALAASIPPLQVPLAVTASRGIRKDADRLTQPQRPSRPSERSAMPDSPPVRRSNGRTAVVGLLVLVAVAGASAAAVHLLNKPATGGSPSRSSTSSGVTAPASAAVITPASARGFDALNPADTGDENSNTAANILDRNPAGWATQQYFTQYFGDLKAGTGLILDLGKPDRVNSITVAFGSVPGANVQIKMGDSDARSAANLASMTTVASKSDVSGSTTFTIQRPVTDRYLVIWFTKLPPIAQGGNRYMAQIFGVVIHGAS